MPHESITVAGNQSQTIRKGRTTTVGGQEAIQVAGDHETQIAGERREQTGKDHLVEVGRDLKLTIAGSRLESVAADVVCRYECDLSVCIEGTSSTTIGPPGQDDGRGDVYVWGTYGIRGTRGGEEQETKPFKMRIVDGAGKAFAGKKYKLMVSGLEIEGETAGDGGISAEIPKDASTATITVWKEKYPTGDTLRLR